MIGLKLYMYLPFAKKLFFFSFQRIRDFQLVGIVLVLVLILCFVLLLWEFVDPLFIVKRPLDKEVSIYFT